MQIVQRLTRHRRVIVWSVVLLVGLALVVAGMRSFRTLQLLLEGSLSVPTGRHWALRWLDRYGLPLVLAAMIVGGAGVPLPANLLLLTMGAGAAEGEQSALLVFAVAVAGLVAGDHLGYLIGWWGGRWLVGRVAHLVGSDDQVPRAGEALRERGAMAVFLTRWLFSPLGPPCNWVCGSVGFPVRRFFVADLLGEMVYVGIYLLLGIAFSEQIAGIAQLVGAGGLLAVGLLLTGLAAWRLLRSSAGPAPAGAGGGRH